MLASHFLVPNLEARGCLAKVGSLRPQSVGALQELHGLHSWRFARSWRVKRSEERRTDAVPQAVASRCARSKMLAIESNGAGCMELG